MSKNTDKMKYIETVMREFDEEFPVIIKHEALLCEETIGNDFKPEIKSFLRTVLEDQEKRLGLDEENIKWCLSHLNKAELIEEKFRRRKAGFDNKVSIYLNVLRRTTNILTKILNFQEGNDEQEKYGRCNT